ncbi:MAG TPA: hypothetical protein VFN07_06435 [Trueperaceae bacterium]|nr:hypothetical protein [Trueperaceae bacterium]
MMPFLRLALTLQHEAHAAVAGADPLEHFTLLPAGHHVADPSGGYEYVLVVAGVIITLLVAVMTIRYVVKPGETAPSHIKRRILRDQR